MKKIILLLLLVLVSVTASARKSYITVFAHPYSGDYYIQMTGDVPSTISGFSYNNNYHYWEATSAYYSVGEVLNMLSGYGYEVELMSGGIQTNNASRVQYLLSKEIPSNQTQIKGDVNTDGEVTIADVNEVIYLILGIVREHPEILEQYGVVLPK